jgi:hypothetical protein
MQLSDYETKSIQKLGESIHSGRWSNDGLVKLIELAGDYLNLCTVPDYAKINHISDVAARKNTAHRKNKVIFNTRYVIDNE